MVDRRRECVLNGEDVTKLSLKCQGFKEGKGDCEESPTEIQNDPLLCRKRFVRAPLSDGKAETGVVMNRTALDLGHVSSLSLSTKLMVNGIVFPAVSPDLAS